MGRPRAKPGTASTDARLLGAAEAEFAQNGYDRARLQDIARAVGISRPSLLYHFGSKEALYAAVIHSGFGRLGEVLGAELVAGGPFDERLETLAEVFSGFLDANPSLATLLLRELVDGRGPGRDLLLEAGVPVLDRVEQFAKGQGYAVTPDGIPIRAALMHLVAGSLVRAAAGPLLEPFWGDRADHARALARALIVRD